MMSLRRRIMMANQDITLPSGYSLKLAVKYYKGLFDGSKFSTNANFRRCYVEIPKKCSKVTLRSVYANNLYQWLCMDTYEKDVSQYSCLGKINNGKIGETTFDIPVGYKYLMVQWSPTTGKDVYVEFLK